MSDADMPIYDRLKQTLKELIAHPIDDLSLEELLIRIQVLTDLERAFAFSRNRAEINLKYLLFGIKDRRRTKFQYWGD